MLKIASKNTTNCFILPVPDLPLCLGVLKHRASLARGAHLPAKKTFLWWIFAYMVQFKIFWAYVCL